MKRLRFLKVLLIAPLLAQASPLLADDASTDASLVMQFGTSAGFREVFDSLRAGVASKDAASVARVVHYPLRVHAGGKKVMIKSEKAFIKSYSKIMRPSIVKAVNEADYGSLFVNSQGAMIGNGEVWISSRCVDKACSRSRVGIITIQESQP